MSGFELIDHTADVGIHAWGDSIEEAFKEAALGMFSLIGDTGKCERKGEMIVVVDNEEWDGLLVDWLSELLYAFDAEHVFLCDFDVKIEKKEKLNLIARAFGETYVPKKHGMHMEIKAVTYHMLKVDPERAEIRVLFDI